MFVSYLSIICEHRYPLSENSNIEGLPEVEPIAESTQVVNEISNNVSKLICCKPCSLKISDECKVCIYCKDKPKYGGKNTLKQKCIERICIKRERKIWFLPLLLHLQVQKE